MRGETRRNGGAAVKATLRCGDCRCVYSDETLEGLYICANRESERFGDFINDDDYECDDGKD